jgi:adenosine deaminase CECR1
MNFKFSKYINKKNSNWKIFIIQKFILISTLFFIACQTNVKNNSSKIDISRNNELNKLITIDQEKSFASNFVLDSSEIQLEKKLVALRKTYEETIQRNNLPFYNEPLHKIKHIVDTSFLYKVFKLMPKGGLLHTHSGGIADINWLIDRAKEYEDCYVYCSSKSEKYLYGQLAIFNKSKVPQGFISLKKKIDSDSKFKDTLYDLLVYKRESLTAELDYWNEFEKRFMRIGQLISYRPFFKEYYKKAFQDLINDNINHIEIRFIFGNLFDFQNDNYSNETTINDLLEIVAELKKENSNFSLNLIYTSFKFLGTEDIDKHLIEAFKLKQKYPNLITGFDLVAEEDRGNSISYYENCWEKLDSLEKVYDLELPLFLHAGESNSVKNKNLYDAVTLKSKRIGHGLNLVYYPNLLEEVKKENILIELNPLSNQILGYVPDLRSHPGRILLSNGVQCALSSDDPGVFGYKGISYDFWFTYLAWELELKVVKKLVFNSILYASLNDEYKATAIKNLEKDWADFISKANLLLESI